MIGWLAVGLLAAGPESPTHPGPPFYLQYEIDTDEVRLMFSGEQRPLGPYLDFEEPFPAPLSVEDEALLMRRARALFAREAGLRIDGQMVLPILDRVQAFDSSGPGNAEPALQFDLRYPCSGMPRTVEVTWSIFEKGADNGVPTLFRQVGGFFEFTAILREEPSYVWHGREQALARPESLQRPVPAAPPRRVVYPLWSLALLALAALATPLLWRRARRAPLLGTWSVALLGAVGLWGVGSEPPWGGRVLLPSPDQALAMFRELHGNIYRAMGARNPDEVYRFLASSVDEDQLDSLYAEVYESLVLREDGGAFCTIEEVQPLGHELFMPSEVQSEADLLFEIDWKWRVRGTVIHHAHQHERINGYRALYSVGYDGEAWKISSWEVLEHRRIEDDGPVEILVGEEDG